MPGVVRTRVGYAGGTTKDPTYHKLGDHTETVQVDYDPSIISYERLLDVFWDSHNPAIPAPSRQYRSIIFYHNDEQKSLAMASIRDQEDISGSKLYTEVSPYSAFYLAEDYHQKYRIRQIRDLMREFSDIYPEFRDFIDSTAVARVNGYAGGNGTLEQLQRELDSYGLSPAGQETLLNTVK